MNIYRRAREHTREIRESSFCPGAAYIRMKLLEPGVTRLLLPPVPDGGDPDREWKLWEATLHRRLGHRVPGTWGRAGAGKRRSVPCGDWPATIGKNDR